MQHKNSNPRKVNIRIFPFTDEHLAKLREEIDDAGGFINFLMKKKAVSPKMGMKHITIYNNIERYREKYLTGVYESLHPMYDTEMPYIFWNAMFEALLKTEEDDKGKI